MEERYLSLSEAADALDISERTAYRWIKSGKLRAYKPGRDYRIPEAALKEAVEASEVHPKEESRSSLEPSLLNGLEDERRSPLSPWAEHARRMAGRIRLHTNDPHSPAFRDPWAALFFVEEKNREAAELYFLLFAEEGGRDPYGDELLAFWEEPLSAFEELAEALDEAGRRADQTGAGRTETDLDRRRQQASAAATEREQAATQISDHLKRRGA